MGLLTQPKKPTNLQFVGSSPMTVLEAIEKINKDKQERRIYPYRALVGEISALCHISHKDVEEELKLLKTAEKIEVVETVNSSRVI